MSRTAIAMVLLLAPAGVATADARSGDAPIPPPEDDEPYGAYGVAVGARFVAASGSVCPEDATCVLGAGGGIAVHISRRWPTGLGIVGGYEIAAHTSSIYDPGLLQALFADVRAEVATSGRLRPFGRAGVQLVVLGNSFAPETAGAGIGVAGGLEVELSEVLSISVAGTTRALWFLPFETVDGAMTVAERSDGGIPTLFFGFELGLVIFPE